jgi:hypothetical protein
MIRYKKSFATLFTIVCLAIIGIITIDLFLIFFINLHSIIYRQIKINAKRNNPPEIRKKSEKVTYAA